MENLSERLPEAAANREIRLLICDDDRTLLFSLTKVLEDAGYGVDATAEPEEAIERLKEKEYNTVICGTFMKAMDGLRFRGMVREITATTPVLFLVGHMNERTAKFMDAASPEANSFFVNREAEREQFLFKLEKVLAEYRFRAYMRQMDATMDTELSLAVDLQRAMLPPFAGLDGESAWCYLYSPYYRISGDVVERMNISDTERVAVYGSLSGHGIHAAMAMMAVQAFLKCWDPGEERGDLPRRLAADLNRKLWESFRGRIYMSALIVHVDLKGNVLQMFNAGYSGMLCINAENRSVPVNPEKRGTMPLGMTPDEEFTEEDQVEFRFRDDDVFAVCSDGILELSDDERGDHCIDMKFVEAATESAVAEARESGRLMVFPFLLHDTLAHSGYSHPHDDLMLAVFAKRTALPGNVRYNDYNHCMRSELGKSADRLEEWAKAEYGEELAGRVGRVARARIGTILGHGFAADALDEESMSVNVVDEGDALTVTMWDYGEANRSDDEDAAAVAEGASWVDGRRMAGKLNEFRFTMPKKAGAAG